MRSYQLHVLFVFVSYSSVLNDHTQCLFIHILENIRIQWKIFCIGSQWGNWPSLHMYINNLDNDINFGWRREERRVSLYSYQGVSNRWTGLLDSPKLPLKSIMNANIALEYLATFSLTEVHGISVLY